MAGNKPGTKPTTWTLKPIKMGSNHHFGGSSNPFFSWKFEGPGKTQSEPVPVPVDGPEPKANPFPEARGGAKPLLGAARAEPGDGTKCERQQKPTKREPHRFPRMSSPFLFLLLFWGSLCFPLLGKKRKNTFFCWGPNSSQDRARACVCVCVCVIGCVCVCDRVCVCV